MRAYEFITESTYQISRHGTWDVAVSDDPVKSPQTGNTLKYIARAVNTRGHGSRKGEVKIAYAMTQAGAIDAVQDTILGLSRASVNPDDYSFFMIDFNVNFTREFINSKHGNYFKIEQDENNQPVLIMASQENYQEFGSDLKDLDFDAAHNRVMNNTSTPAYGIPVKTNKVKQLKLIPNMRYVTDYIRNDIDGNLVFKLTPHSRYTGDSKTRMGEPGFILAATPKETTIK